MIYNKIILYDKQKIDYLVVLDNVALKQQIERMNTWEVIPDWEMWETEQENTNIKILAPFTDSLISSYISSLTSPIVGYEIYRQKVSDKEENKMHPVAKVDALTYHVADYLACNRTEYVYYVIPITENEMAFTLKSPVVKTNWSFWTITELFMSEEAQGIYLAQDTWSLQLDLVSDARQYNMDKTVFENNSQYPKVAVGDRNYISGSLTCKIGQFECSTRRFDDTVEMIKAWRKFACSDHPALLRDVKGNAWLVKITSASEQTIDKYSDQPIEISFDFVEIGDTDDIMIYSKD